MVASGKPVCHHVCDACVVGVGAFLREVVDVVLRLWVPAIDTIAEALRFVTIVNRDLIKCLRKPTNYLIIKSGIFCLWDVN